MAQIINIPLAFEFRPQKATWSVRTVEIKGWAKELRKPSLIRYLGPADDVVVEITEPGSLTGLYGPLGMGRAPAPRVAMHWKDISADIRGAATRAKKMDEIQGRYFQILLCDSPLGGAKGPGDAWSMRKEFLSLKKETLALCGFLKKWGVWDERKPGSLNVAPGDAASILNLVVPEAIWELQSAYRAALVSPPGEWLSKGVDPFKGAYATPMYPHFILQHYQCKKAIEATITIDLLRKVKFRKCKRHDCSEVFEIESRHRRMYCGQPCAHLESVRKQRRAAAKLKKKSTAKKGVNDVHFQARERLLVSLPVQR